MLACHLSTCALPLLTSGRLPSPLCSGVRLELGDAEGALEDASAAADCAPPGFTTAAIRQVRLGRACGACGWLLGACTSPARCPSALLFRGRACFSTNPHLNLSHLPSQVEALLRLRRFRAAMECLLAARQQHPGFADTEDYQRCVADVQAALEAADVQP